LVLLAAVDVDVGPILAAAGNGVKTPLPPLTGGTPVDTTVVSSNNKHDPSGRKMRVFCRHS
jgi:hypothetical protein